MIRLLRNLAYITEDYTAASIPLSQAVVKQVPLFKEFNVKLITLLSLG
ncbi:hypothetical protein NHP200010_15650 [Helicobacter bizzozeronii]|nr:hypothetical protein [Helicobacter bizzozeronii]GMB93832.1 hypothetical protein NHP200010_15650 [Helicobacter bizzozeronii]